MLRELWSNFVKLSARTAGFVTLRGHHFYPGSLGPNSWVVDLGVHKGEFSQLMTSQFGCSVLGLEANPSLFATLPALPRVTFLNLAIHRENAPVVFHLSDNPESSSVFEEVATSAGGLTPVAVTGITLDSLLAQHKLAAVDLLKVDIESAEFQMLELATDATLSRINQITVEFHVNAALPAYSVASVQAISHRLQRLGFRTFVMDRLCTDVLFLQPSRLPWKLTERVAMVIYRLLIMPARKLMDRTPPPK